MNDATIAAVLALAILAVLGLGGRLRGIVLEFPTRERLAAAALLLWLIMIAAVAMPAVLSGSGGAALDPGEFSFPALFTGHALLAGFLFAWWQLRRPIRLSSFLYLRGATADDVRGGLLLGLRVWAYTIAIALIAGLILQGLYGLVGEMPIDTAELPEVPEIPDVMLWLVDLPVAGKLLVVLAAMTVEEAFFRAFLQTRIGLVPSSILFAIAHASYGLPTLMIGVFVVSIIIGIDFARHRQLLRSILAHGVFDAIQLLVIVPLAVEQLTAM